MKTVKVTEKFDSEGRVVERVTETTETIETAPFNPFIAPYPYQPFPPLIIGQPNTNPQPQITWTSGNNCSGGIQ